ADLLLHANTVLSADQLIEDLWGEKKPTDSAHALQVLVSQLRRGLASAHTEELLVTRPPGYMLRTDLEHIDSHRFEQLVQTARATLSSGDAVGASAQIRDALSLWRGTPLSDFTYESFAQPAISRLEELRLAAIQERIEADLSIGRHVELVAELEELARKYPVVERFRAQLMLALYRSGRQAEALAVYKETRRALVEALGIEPSPDLHELEQAILRQDSSLALEGRSGTEAERTPAADVAARSILVASRDPVRLQGLLEVASPLARSDLSRELVVFLATGPNPDDLSEAASVVAAQRTALAEEGVDAHAASFTSADPAGDLVQLASEHEADLLLMALGDSSGAADALDATVQEVLERAPCDVALLVARTRERRKGPILAAFGGAEHDWMALELSAWIASATGSSLKLIGPVADPTEGRRDASKLLAHASIVVQRFVGIPAEPVLTEPGSDSLLAAAESAALLVVGFSDRWRDEGLGVVRSKLAQTARPPVLFVRRGSQGALTTPESMTRFRWSLTTGPDGA